MDLLGATATSQITADMRTVIEAGEAIEASELVARGCSIPEISGFKRASWKTEDWHHTPTPWQKVYDLWPTGYTAGDELHPTSLLLHGDVGSGKSSIAAAAMRRSLALGMTCGWIDFPAAIKAERNAVRTGSPTTDQALAFSQLCIVDDVWALREEPTEHQKEFMVFLISRREQAGYTIYTTNFSPEALREIDARTASRMMAGPAVPVPGGDSRRKKWKLT